MEISSLTRNQQIALVALVEQIAMSDGRVAEGEQKKIGQIVESLGEDRYRELLDDADERFADEDALKTFVLSIDDQEARNAIFGAVMEETMLAPSQRHEKSEWLDWLKTAWAIRIAE